LQKQFEDFRDAEKAYGVQTARKYIQRVNIIKHAHDIEELKRLPGMNCHPLKGNRKGQWAIKLTGFYRLIFTLLGDCLEIVRIGEVSKHYGD
jgi:proteic killer suppression protein